MKKVNVQFRVLIQAVEEGVKREGKVSWCGWLNVDQSKAERNHSLMESAQHDFMFAGASAKGR